MPRIWPFLSLLIALVVGCSGSERSSAPTNVKSRSVKNETAGLPKILTLSELNDRIRTCEGKVVVLDLWALW